MQLWLSGPAGELQLRLANRDSGTLQVADAQGLQPPLRIEGFWRERDGGYDIELALPQAFGLRALGIGAFDVDAEGRRRSAGNGPGGSPELWPLYGYVGALEPSLLALAPPGMRAAVVDRQAWVLARAGQIAGDQSHEDLLP